MMGLSRHDILRPLRRATFVGLGYFISAGIGVSLTVQPQSIASFWPASGLLVGALVISRTQSWPPILIAVLVAVLVLNLLMGKSPGVSFAFAFVNSLEGFIGAWLLLSYSGPRPRMTRVRDVLRLVVLAGLVSPALASTLATAVVVTAVGASYVWHAWFTWWVADMLGVLMVAPLILGWPDARALAFKSAGVSQIAEAILLAAAMLLVAVFIFGAES